MKVKHILYTGLLAITGCFVSCIDDDTNRDDGAVTEDATKKPEWFLNASVGASQMNPHIAERIFVLTWKSAAHFERGGSFAIGADNNDWMKDYLDLGYSGGALRDANYAVSNAEKLIEADKAGVFPYYKNILQISRIWRAYMYAELTDGFGPMPLEAFNGVNPTTYNSVEEVYQFILDELKDAESKLNTNIPMNGKNALGEGKLDQFYGNALSSDVTAPGYLPQWIKYANSLRMRYAMRLSKADAVLAKKHFEEAASKIFISESTDIAQVSELDGWSWYSGVMSRTWNPQVLSPTLRNLMVGLGGQEFPVDAALTSKLKDPNTYMGLRLTEHFPSTTNDPAAGYFFDGIPKYIDPRGATLFSITGHKDTKGIYPAAFPKESWEPSTLVVKLLPTAANTDTLRLDVKNTWSTVVSGVWDKKSTLSADYVGKSYAFPALAQKFRGSSNKRVFFGPWESYFLLAEAAVYGWAVPGTAQSNYEAGIKASFEYNGVANKLSAYLASQDYNRVGTSVAFNHTAEATNYTINYVDGYTGVAGTTTYEYPKNSIYKGGAFNNDVLTKIITQKYLAQMPWLPLEAWSDHRRLGLPFIENQAVEVAYTGANQVPLTPATSKDCDWKYYPQRYRYPSVLPANNAPGYNSAVSNLGAGGDKTSTPLWWTAR